VINENNMHRIVISFLFLGVFCSCGNVIRPVPGVPNSEEVLPIVITEKSLSDTDDPAIWINRGNPSESLVLGTDKDKDNGGIYVYDLNGRIDRERTVLGLKRPNNIDVEYGIILNSDTVDIAVFTERGRSMIRVFTLPNMIPVDGGGIPVFEGETGRDPMGLALYKDLQTGYIYAIVSRKEGTDGSYLWQYLLSESDNGAVKGQVVRKFGTFSGKKEIEAIAVDNQLGFIYYSDEQVGVRKYYASPERGNEELALFATNHVVGDHEGLSIYPTSPTTGYIILSDQQGNRFQIFPREGANGNPHHHPLLKVVPVLARDSDGSDVTPYPLNETFKHGLFVAMSNDKTFHFYRWEDIAGNELSVDGFWE